MLESCVECDSFRIIYIDSILVYENKYYLQVYYYTCAYEIVGKQMVDLMIMVDLPNWPYKCCITIELI